jgi:peptidoglycan/LPS O-acetylase OafA/YrhL
MAVHTTADSPRRPWGEPGPTTLPALDGLRAVAVLAVLLTHVGFQSGATLNGTAGQVLARLDIGVTLFFLLSGFLLYRPFVAGHFAGRPAPRLGAYLRNRALRILPAYWLLVLVAVPLISPLQRSVEEVVRQLLLLQTLETYHLLQGLTHTWSLVVEAGFYLLLPLLAALSRPRRPRSPDAQLRVELLVLAGMVVVALGWQTAVHHVGLGDERVTALWLPGFLDWFALGMGLAVLRTWSDARGDQRMDDLGGASFTCWGIGALLFWLSTTPLAGPLGLAEPTTWETLLKHVLYGLAAAFLLLPALAGRASPVRRLLSSRPARYLGRISYGVFLWHLVALWAVFELPAVEPFDGQFWLVLGLTLPLSLLLAQVSLRVVEEPALRRKLPALPGR